MAGDALPPLTPLLEATLALATAEHGAMVSCPVPEGLELGAVVVDGLRHVHADQGTLAAVAKRDVERSATVRREDARLGLPVAVLSWGSTAEAGQVACAFGPVVEVVLPLATTPSTGVWVTAKGGCRSARAQDGSWTVHATEGLGCHLLVNGRTGQLELDLQAPWPARIEGVLVPKEAAAPKEPEPLSHHYLLKPMVEALTAPYLQAEAQPGLSSAARDLLERWRWQEVEHVETLIRRMDPASP
ncbi:MAG: hypothetical protein H6735_33700 [Alphaproteobacteria bacterium]|nr:hypothetical protein [Alphaproteobacteria bacterium]